MPQYNLQSHIDKHLNNSLPSSVIQLAPTLSRDLVVFRLERRSRSSLPQTILRTSVAALRVRIRPNLNIKAIRITM
jgi:hypothetical protein